MASARVDFMTTSLPVPLRVARNHPWSFVPTLYFFQGLPYGIVMLLSTVFFKNAGVSNGEIALWTSGFYLPWVIKPLWSPLLEVLGKKRSWIIGAQFSLALTLLFLAYAVQSPSFFLPAVALLWVCAFLSATHDIAADGFYLLALTKKQQSYFAGAGTVFIALPALFVRVPR